MKIILNIAILVQLCMLTSFSFTQNNSIDKEVAGDEFQIKRNDASNPCTTAQQYSVIEKQCAENIKLLKLKGIIGNKQDNILTNINFNWPLRTSAGLNDYSFYVITNYVDQDPTSGIKDWNCGAVSYDTHRGTDISTWPYPFYKMDNNQVEVIAAAPGTIINKGDGNFDKNCAINNLNPNYIAIQHSDGSIALYYHLKMNSLTVKNIGQTVVTGEFLGIVGSSGSSTGPHLHFEVWATANYNSLVDPYSGPCNILNANSLWAVQKPYTEPAIIRTQVNKILAVFPECPSTETPNEDSCFTAGETARFYIFIRNETKGMTANIRIVNPDGTTFSSWTRNSNNNFSGSYWISNKPVPNTTGTYTFEAVYNADTCSKHFDVINAAITASDSTTFCDGDSVILTVDAANSYLWSNGAKSQSITVRTSGDYFVVVTSSKGCSATSSVTTVTVNPLPIATITASGTTTFCEGDSVTLTASSASSYLWSNSETTQSIIVKSSGDYSVVVTNSFGCSATSQVTSVTFYSLPSTPTITENGNILSSSSPIGNQWYLNGSIIMGANSQNYTALENGNYTVEITDSNGCSTTSSPYYYISDGIDELNDENVLLIIPNPANVYIELSKELYKETEIKIFSTIGVIVYEGKPEKRIDISNLSAGIYFVMVKDKVYKFVKM